MESKGVAVQVNLKKQKGVGISEVIIALMLLSIGVVGFTVLQTKAMYASEESLKKVKAMDLAMDMAERIRVNPSALTAYDTALATAAGLESGKSLNCFTNFCSVADKAKFDVYQVLIKAKADGLYMLQNNCPGSSATGRKCLYVVWGETIPAHAGAAATTCTVAAAGAANQFIYREGASCVVMESF